MKMLPARKLLKYTFFGAAALGTASITALSYKGNRYEIEAIGLLRFGRAAVTAVDIGLHYKKNLYDTDLDSGSPEYLSLRSKTHKEAAQKLLDLCCANKGVFIKVGQHIGSLEYLLPHEYVQTMKVLHSHAPQSALEDIFVVLKEELHQDPKEVFVEFDPEPLGTASLAQVHRARLAKNGQVVAVKVQHPYVKGNSLVDMKTMEVLVTILSWVFPEFKFMWLVDETKKNIPRELDFRQEAANTIKVKNMFRHFSWLKVPEVVGELSTGRVLTMEYVEGGQVNDVDYMRRQGIDPFEVSDKLGQLYSEMIFTKGFVHSDPHPGNILVARHPPTTSIVLLDHGLYAHISDSVRSEYSGLWLSILSKDKEGMKRHGEALGVGQLYDLFACMVAGRSWTAIQSGIVVNKHTKHEKEQFQRDLPLVLAKITETLHNVNREMLLILKTNDLLRGIEYTLRTNNRMSSFLVMSKSCIKCVYDEKIRHTSNAIDKLRINLAERWELFKISMYYTYLSIITFSWRSIFRIT